MSTVRLLLLLLALLPLAQGAAVILNPTEWVNEHNKRRCLHGVPNLVWNNAAAQSMARSMDAVGCWARVTPSHTNKGTGYGENLAWQNWPSNGPDALTRWYDQERPYYNYRTGTTTNSRQQIGHFTAVVWKATTSVGCARCSGGGRFVIGCRYAPQGNIIGQFVANVPVHRASCSSTPPPPPPPPPASVPTFPSGGSCMSLPGYLTNPNRDAPGNDIGNFGPNRNNILAACASRLQCRSFNDKGWVKRVSGPMQQAPQCLYVAWDLMPAGWQLGENAALKSKDGRFLAWMQRDGNFVLYSGNNPVWATGTNGRGRAPRRVVMQPDGNLVLYDAGNAPLWSSNTWGRGAAGHRLVMQNDRNLVIYDGNWAPTWSSNTWTSARDLDISEADLAPGNESDLVDFDFEVPEGDPEPFVASDATKAADDLPNMTSMASTATAPSNTTSENGTPTWVWAVVGSIVGAATLASILGVVLIMKSRQHRSDSEMLELEMPAAASDLACQVDELPVLDAAIPTTTPC